MVEYDGTRTSTATRNAMRDAPTCARSVCALFASLVVLVCVLACTIPTAVGPPPPIGTEISGGGGEAAGTLTTEVSGIAGGPVSEPETRGVGIGAASGVTLQVARFFATKFHFAGDPAGAASGGIARLGGQFRIGFGSLAARNSGDEQTMDTARSRGPGGAFTFDLGIGAGGYNTLGGCTAFACGGSSSRSYEQFDVGIHLVAAAYGNFEAFFGILPALGTMYVVGSDQAIFYLGADTGVRVRLPGHVALTLTAAYHAATGSNVVIEDAQVAQVTFGLQWTSPNIWRRHDDVRAPRVIDYAPPPSTFVPGEPPVPQSLPPVQITP